MKETVAVCILGRGVGWNQVQEDSAIFYRLIVFKDVLSFHPLHIQPNWLPFLTVRPAWRPGRRTEDDSHYDLAEPGPPPVGHIMRAYSVRSFLKASLIVSSSPVLVGNHPTGVRQLPLQPVRPDLLGVHLFDGRDSDPVPGMLPFQPFAPRRQPIVLVRQAARAGLRPAPPALPAAVPGACRHAARTTWRSRGRVRRVPRRSVPCTSQRSRVSSAKKPVADPVDGLGAELALPPLPVPLP